MREDSAILALKNIPKHKIMNGIISIYHQTPIYKISLFTFKVLTHDPQTLTLSLSLSLSFSLSLFLTMSTLNHLFDLPEQICYVQCGFCDTILLVSVPCSSLSMVVTVRCGHCTSLLSVNMLKVSFVPLQLLASLSHDQQKEVNPEAAVGLRKTLDIQRSSSMVAYSDHELEEDKNPENRVINKPPEKRQRAPSAYNRFIKEEIRRLKTENPNMAHKEAFSTAAKNWANFPPIHYKEGGESCGQEDEETTWNCDAAESQVNVEGKGFHERKAPRHSIWARTPFE
ncbi:axial regulator YABBY 4 isoform X2 [Jatropha curcas]|uniref:axial regulator YABBY 4 isoform X2 n=1 Tax=Jatropha curcas TaxID=180498 RepID=UPI0009D6EAC6|nr:axial regulator YABBY 4 isoform X2 [Jatropha curcas]